MKLSVIIPVYNTEKYLSRCVDSVLGQSFTDFELLLVDDGSTDDSGTICDEYAEKDNRVRVFHKENGGASSARNLGLDHAQGEWVTFIDSDDYIEDDFFSIPFGNGFDLFAQNWSYSNGEIKESFSSCIAVRDIFQGFLSEHIHSDMFRTACCFFFKGNIINENNIRFETRFRLGEDTLFVMDYYKYASSIQIMDNSCYKYNRQENWDDKYVLSWKEAEEYLNVFMDKYDTLELEAPRLLSFMFSFIQKRIKKDEKQLGRKWALSEPVLRYKKIRLPNEGIVYRLKYIVCRLLSVIVHV